MSDDEEVLQALRGLDRPIAPGPEIDERTRAKIVDELKRLPDSLGPEGSEADPGAQIVSIGETTEEVRDRWWIRPAVGLVAAAACLVVTALIWSTTSDPARVQTDAADNRQEADPSSEASFCLTHLPAYVRSYEGFQGSGLDPSLANRNEELLAAQQMVLEVLMVAADGNRDLGEELASDLTVLDARLEATRALIDEDAIDPVVIDSLGTFQAALQETLDGSHPLLTSCDISGLDWQPNG